MDRDGVLTKNDPVKSLAARDYQFILSAVNKPVEPIILNGKRTAFYWYFGTFYERYPNFAKRRRVEDKLVTVLSGLLKHRRAYLSDAATKNNSIDELRELNGFAQSLDILREIFTVVHESQWSVLFSRWIWWDDELNDDWMKQYFRTVLKIYDTKDDFERGNWRHIFVSNQIIPASAIETILAILCFPTKLFNYGYQNVEFYKLAKDCWWTWYRNAHYISREDRINNELKPALIDFLAPNVADRYRKDFEEEKIEYEYNNCLMKTEGEGSTGVEALNANVNYKVMQKAQRTFTTAFMQQTTFFVKAVQAHYPRLIQICHTITDDIKTEMQTCFTEINLIYEFLKNKTRPRNPFIKFKRNVNHVEQWMKAYIANKQLPAPVKLTTRWHKRSSIYNSVLLNWLVLEAKCARIKLDVKRRNSQTLLPEYQSYPFDFNDSDVDEEIDEILSKEQLQSQQDVICHLVHSQNRKYRMGSGDSMIGCSANINHNKNNNKSNHNNCRNHKQESLASIRYNLTSANVGFYQWEPVPLERVEWAKTNVFKNRFKTSTICNKITDLFFKVER